MSKEFMKELPDGLAFHRPVPSFLMDVLKHEQRQLNMSRIRGKDTKPDMMLRTGLHRAGLRFRLHARELPGRPGLIFPRSRAAVLIHGCFWHGHDCPMFKLSRTRTQCWAAKIAGSRARQPNEAALFGSACRSSLESDDRLGMRS